MKDLASSVEVSSEIENSIPSKKDTDDVELRRLGKIPVLKVL